MEPVRWSSPKTVGVWVAVVIGVAVACSQVDSPRAPAAARAHVVAHEVHGAAYRRLTPAQQARLEGLKGQFAWTGQVHNEIMGDLKRRWSTFHTASKAVRCQAVLDAVMARVPEMRVHAPAIISDDALRAQLIQQLGANKHCANVTPSNMLPARVALVPALIHGSLPPGDDTVTAAGFALAQSVSDAIAGSSGMPDDVAAAADDALAAGSDLSDQDYGLASGEADIGISSSSGWYDYGNSGGFTSVDSTPYYISDMSVFQSPGPWWKALMNPMTATDAVAGLGGMYLANIAGVKDNYTLLLTGTASAALASGLYFIALA